jgi:excisionase family DNA binding protein
VLPGASPGHSGTGTILQRKPLSGDGESSEAIASDEERVCGLQSSREAGGAAMADSREVMNIRQASQYLGVSPDTLYKYVSEEKIPAFKLGNRWKFKKSILDSWMEDKSLTTEVPRPRKVTKTARAAVSG